MIVDQAIYRDGVRLACADLRDELSRLRSEHDGFLWIGLHDPTDEEFALVNEELALHPLAVEDAVNGNQRAKIEAYENSLFAVLKTLRYVEATSDVETGEVMLFVGDRFVVTVRRGEANPLAGVRHRLEANRDQLTLGPVAVLHAVMDSVVDNYVLIDEELREDLDRIERQVLGEGSDEADARTIYRLKREILEFRRAALPLADAIRRLHVSPLSQTMDEQVIPFFRDVEDHLARVNDHVESYDRLLTVVLSAHLAQVSVQQNNDMRRISAWVAMAAVPTMIAGIYGMNFRYLPELEASVTVGEVEVYWGYFAVLGLMAATVFGLFRFFRRHRWL
ncbi:MAG: magnesium/cobalt transporter CorA [Dermatophilaceae bacterium]